MTETEYIIVKNQIHIDSALKILSEVSTGESAGIDKGKLAFIRGDLIDISMSLKKLMPEIEVDD